MPGGGSHGWALIARVVASFSQPVRLFMGQYQKAIIFDRYTGVAVYNIRPGAGGLQVRYGSGIDFKEWERESARRRKAWEAELARRTAA